MNRFYSSVMEPILQASEAKIIVEIGAFAGANTRNLLDFCRKSGAELHTIDPKPHFDAQKLSNDYNDSFNFYQDLSLNVIPKLPRFDVGIIDGDHNWYTVYNELKQIEALHNADGLRFPIIFLHDIGWPYGRRDLYYSDSTIPEEFRHPSTEKGIYWGQSKLSDTGGLNKQLSNALHECGERNGVLTALEDFMGESSLEFDLIKIPAYFGIGILFTMERYRHDKAMRSSLKEITGTEGLLRIMETLEMLRANDMIVMQELNWEVQDLRQKLAGNEDQPE